MIILLMFLKAIQVLFTVALVQNQQGVEQLKSRVLEISDPFHSDYGRFMTVPEISKYVAPPSYVSQSVNTFLNNQGFNCEINQIADSITCSGDYQLAQKVFQINSNKTGHIIPAEISKYVVFIDGLTNYNATNEISPKVSINGAPQADPGYVGREVMARLNGLPNGLNTQTISAAAIEYQGQSGYFNPDVTISQFENQEPLSRGVNVSVGPNIYPDTETELDLQMISQTAENVDLWYIGGTQWLYTLIVSVLNSNQVPDMMSMSWGWSADQMCTISHNGPCANGTSQQYVERVDTEYAKAGAMGVTITVASGDAGAPGRTNEGCTNATSPSGRVRTVNAVYPGSSPWVTSVGATFVVANTSDGSDNFTSLLCTDNQPGCATGTQQAQINQASVGWTAGGGVTYYQSLPTWQNASVHHYLGLNPPLPGAFNHTHLGRFYPDVVALGHNCPTWQKGCLSPVDGTSCSCPVVCGFLTDLSAYQVSRGKPKLGFANPLIYRMAETPGIFTDITTGNNYCTEMQCCPTRADSGSDYGYVATQGYDPVTGHGFMNVTAATLWLTAHT